MPYPTHLARQPTRSMSSTVTFDIPRDPTAPSAARRAIDALTDRIAPDVVPDVKLLVSELITNSVKYGGNGGGPPQGGGPGPRQPPGGGIHPGGRVLPGARHPPP